MYEVKFSLNERTIITVQGESDREVVSQISFFSELPQKCPKCGAGVHFYHRRPQGFDYYGLECEGKVCHETSFGIAKEGHRLFYKGYGSWKDRPLMIAAGDAPQDAEPVNDPFADKPASQERSGGNGGFVNDGPDKCQYCHAPAGKPHSSKCDVRGGRVPE